LFVIRILFAIWMVIPERIAARIRTNHLRLQRFGLGRSLFLTYLTLWAGTSAQRAKARWLQCTR
jgi:hypothetical protein